MFANNKWIAENKNETSRKLCHAIINLILTAVWSKIVFHNLRDVPFLFSVIQMWMCFPFVQYFSSHTYSTQINTKPHIWLAVHTIIVVTYYIYLWFIPVKCKRHSSVFDFTNIMFTINGSSSFFYVLPIFNMKDRSNPKQEPNALLTSYIYMVRMCLISTYHLICLYVLVLSTIRLTTFYNLNKVNK